MFSIVYNYSLLDGIRDTLIVTSMGAEALNVLDFYGVLPAVFVLMLIYIKMTNYWTRRTIFYGFSLFFLVFYLLFAFFLYPHQAQIHVDPTRIAQYIVQFPYLKWQIMALGQWSFSCFYVMTELWCAMMLNLLFWEFANHITQGQEALRYYPLFGFLSNLAVVLSGYTLSFITQAEIHSIAQNNHMIQIIMLCVVFFCLVGGGVYAWIGQYILTNPILYTPKEETDMTKEKTSVWKSLQVLMVSKHLRWIAYLVFFYGISISFIEAPWKAALHEVYPTELAYTQFLGTFLKWKGWAVMLMMLLGSFIIHRMGWFIGAMTTPVVILVTGILFYTFIILHPLMGGLVPLAVTVGSIQIILSKATKYAMFDATKEMLYIPLNQTLRTQGKSAIDMVGGRLSRSLGAFLQSLIFMLFPFLTYKEVTPYLMGIFLLTMITWIIIVKKIYRAYGSLIPSHSGK